MYEWYCHLKYLLSSDSRIYCLRISSAFTIWRHWSTWAAWCWTYLGTSAASALIGTGAACGGRAGYWNYCPVTVWYVYGCIDRPRRPFYPHPYSEWMVYAFAWILWWILRMNFWSMTPSYFVIYLKGNFLRIYDGLEIIIVLWIHWVWCDRVFLNWHGYAT